MAHARTYTGSSLLVGLTDYCGGELEVQEEGAFPTSESMVFFDGSDGIAPELPLAYA